MAPEGRFSIHPDNNVEKHYVGVAAGSGITPILSMIKSVLLVELKSTFTLYYINKDSGSAMFTKEIEEYQHRYPENLKVYNLFTRQDQENALFNGRITKDKFMDLMRENKEVPKSDGIYICGPEDMIFDVSAALKDFGYNKDNVHYELFGTPSDKMKDQAPVVESDVEGESQVTVIMEGDEFEQGQTLCTIEAMKMEYTLKAEKRGVVKTILAQVNQSISVDQLIMEFE
jgi:ring-1,2-phenylacetyl-CoA epoxidase subunit PaaE